MLILLDVSLTFVLAHGGGIKTNGLRNQIHTRIRNFHQPNKTNASIHFQFGVSSEEILYRLITISINGVLHFRINVNFEKQKLKIELQNYI